MIQFFINNVEIVLPSDFSAKITEENPLITRNGEFSLDITTSLSVKQNAIAFNHINRINNSIIDLEGDAIMKIDHVSRFGKYIVISYTDKSVTWQFVAGNSEINYLTNTDKKVWELNWGTEAPITFALALQSINMPGYGVYSTWTQNYVCAPVRCKDKSGGSIVLNDYTLNVQTSNEVPNLINGCNNIVMQPYLLYYINKLPELLGFTLVSNILNTDNRARRLYLLNTVQSLQYHYALPDVSVIEFMEMIENFFNVEFVIDSTNKTMAIQRATVVLGSMPVIQLTNVLDNYEVETEADNKSSKFNLSELSYDLPDNTYYKYNDISDDILNKSEIVTKSSVSTVLSHIKDLLTLPYDVFKIYRATAESADFIAVNETLQVPSVDFFCYPITFPGFDDYYRIIMLVNKLKGVRVDDNKLSLKLKMYPAQLSMQKIRANFDIDGISGSLECFYQLTISEKSLYLPLNIGFKATIEESESDVNRLDKCEISLFSGKIRPFQSAFESFGLIYPFSHVDEYPDFRKESLNKIILTEFMNWVNNHFKPSINTSLKIKGTNGVYNTYYTNNIIDTSRIFVFELVENKKLTVNNLFEYQNQEYIAIKFERVVSNNSTKTVLGHFYRLKK